MIGLRKKRITARHLEDKAMRYTYLGDKLTDEKLKGMQCDPIRRGDGKCIIGRTPRNQLVVDANGQKYVVLARRLRLNNKEL